MVRPLLTKRRQSGFRFSEAETTKTKIHDSYQFSNFTAMIHDSWFRLHPDADKRFGTIFAELLATYS